MNEHAPAIFRAIEASSFAAGIRASSWAYMAANVGHILSLTIFAGAIAVMDLRMLGVFSATTPGFVIRKARTFAGFALLGMALAILLFMPACQTMNGAGKDIERAGEKIQENSK